MKDLKLLDKSVRVKVGNLGIFAQGKSNIWEDTVQGKTVRWEERKKTGPS